MERIPASVQAARAMGDIWSQGRLANGVQAKGDGIVFHMRTKIQGRYMGKTGAR